MVPSDALAADTRSARPGAASQGRRNTMNANRVWGLMLSAGFLVALGSVDDAAAQSKTAKAKPAASPAVAAEPPITKKPIKVDPAELAWGMPPKKVAEVYDKVLDDDYRPKYKQASPGVQMKNLDAALAEEKAAFRRSRIDFGKLPTGVDSTPLRGEFTYLNKEAMMSLTRNGQSRYFFFIGERLWKIVDEIKLSDTSKYGKDFKEATARFGSHFGVPGRVLPADAPKGRFATEVDWKDSASHIRIVQRSDTSMAIIIEDGATLAQLASLRTAKPTSDDGIDPAVKAATANPPTQAGPPADKTKAGEKEKKPAAPAKK
jgi:hypothetical protein